MENLLKIKVRQNHTIARLLESLVDFGYDHNIDKLTSGQFRQVGGVVEVFPVNIIYPIRIDFFGDNIDSIFVIDKETNEKINSINEIAIERNNLVVGQSIISPLDYIVHEDHGIGIFSHKETLLIENEEIVYISIRYLNDDLLRVPMSQEEKLSRYFGIGKKRPRLSKLGSITWKKTYQKTYENVLFLAKELLFVYAHRQVSQKKPIKIHLDWNEEITKSFGFKETKDQISAIENVFSDLQKETPMDRLICGDVGFGKTEVAIRAIGQVVANGLQATILVPTTILAEQHYITIKERLGTLPVRVERLSRFIEKKEQDKILVDLADGKIDVLISTHKILRAKTKFKNLGLLVVDEEQKFGVKDKEQLKQIKKDIDVLTLTATPIPRTLFMALSGLRDISLINSIPEGRKSVETKVLKYDEDIIKQAIERETSRGGQVYYLHNKVSTITGLCLKLRKSFPKKRIEVAHGQMNESMLSKAMSDFTAKKIDVLVCSTIIENGLDLPNANTLIVDEADRFGLSQLYQIRGRIGRSKKQSHALFTYTSKNLTLNALKRLKAIVENSELGTGYNLALHDLEIRGGGNILGRDQHGNMEAVGLVLYGKLLNKAVEKLKT